MDAGDQPNARLYDAVFGASWFVLQKKSQLRIILRNRVDTMRRSFTRHFCVLFLLVLCSLNAIHAKSKDDEQETLKDAVEAELFAEQDVPAFQSPAQGIPYLYSFS